MAPMCITKPIGTRFCSSTSTLYHFLLGSSRLRGEGGALVLLAAVAAAVADAMAAVGCVRPCAGPVPMPVTSTARTLTARTRTLERVCAVGGRGGNRAEHAGDDRADGSVGRRAFFPRKRGAAERQEHTGDEDENASERARERGRGSAAV